MSNELLEEEVETIPQDDYDTEYDKAWGDEPEELEQPNVEEEVADEQDESEIEEDSNNKPITDEDQPVDESDKAEEQSNKDFVETLKWNKQQIPVTREELIALAQKGFDAEKKWRDASIDRPLKEIISKHKLTAEDLTLLADARSGNAEAIALLAKKANIDLYDAEHKSYTPVVEERNYELDDVIAEINKDESIATQMNDYVSSVPQSVKNLLVSKPEILRGLNIDMQNGIAQKVMPEVIKQLAINPDYDFVELYRTVGHKVLQPVGETPKETKRVEPTREDKKRMGISKKNPVPKKDVTDDYDAAWDDDSHFNAVRARLRGF